ncbi:MAG: energy transducer TonB [Rhodocyclales bacterium]|nr:energy transducer TonB [Rhodocyclales bacterium]
MRLALAGLISLLLHALVMGGGPWLLRSPAKPAPPPEPQLQAVLLPKLPAPVLLAPETAAPAATAPSPQRAAAKPEAVPAARRARAATADLTTQASRQIAARLFYPPEAIARGLEGEALVLLFLDEAGNAVAARLERSSGHALLDSAAVGAAQAVRALPVGAPQEVLLPVRFRLR